MINNINNNNNFRKDYIFLLFFIKFLYKLKKIMVKYIKKSISHRQNLFTLKLVLICSLSQKD